MAALDGIRIVDLTQWEAGTSCTQLLAWLGAEVIKIEPPQGEPGRRLINDLPGKDGYYFILFNSNKRAITLDLKKPKGRELFSRLVARADVVAENFAQGVFEELGFGYQALTAIKPDIIHASLKGFGSWGPYSNYKCFDPIAMATGGVLSVCGTPETPPLKPGVSFGDSGSGVHLGMAILAAYIERLRTGNGQYVEVSMQDAMVSFCRTAFLPHYLMGGVPAARYGNRVGLLSPTDLYPCKGGGPNDYAFLMVTTRRMWHGILRVIEREDLIGDERFEEQATRNSHWNEVEELIGAWTRRHDKHEVMRRMGEAGVPCGAVMDSADLYGSQHLKERAMIVEINHADRGVIPVPGCPLKMGNTPNVKVEASETLAASNAHVYGEILGLDRAAIDALHADGVI